MPIAPDVLLPGDPGRAMALAQTLLVAPKMHNLHRGLWGYSGETIPEPAAAAEHPVDRHGGAERRDRDPRARRAGREAGDQGRHLRRPGPFARARRPAEGRGRAAATTGSTRRSGADGAPSPPDPALTAAPRGGRSGHAGDRRDHRPLLRGLGRRPRAAGSSPGAGAVDMEAAALFALGPASAWASRACWSSPTCSAEASGRRIEEEALEGASGDGPGRGRGPRGLARRRAAGGGGGWPDPRPQLEALVASATARASRSSSSSTASRRSETARSRRPSRSTSVAVGTFRSASRWRSPGWRGRAPRRRP